jgi:hypothetical protein
LQLIATHNPKSIKLPDGLKNGLPEIVEREDDIGFSVTNKKGNCLFCVL